jgi:hypothetical protein
MVWEFPFLPNDFVATGLRVPKRFWILDSEYHFSLMHKTKGLKRACVSGLAS